MFKRHYIDPALAIGNNSFGLVRLLAACSVVVSHAWLVTGGSDVLEPLRSETGYTLGWHAVSLFFALSGLLVVGSLHHTKSVKQFIWARFLRIYPALLTVTVITFAASVVYFETFIWQWSAVFEYFMKNATLFGEKAILPGLFENNPIPDEINAPLWTLKYEVIAYISVVCVSIVSWRFPRVMSFKLMAITIVSTTALGTLSFDVPEDYGRIEHLFRFLFSFFLGVTVWLFRDKIYLRGVDLAILTVINFGLISFDIHLIAVQIIWLSYCGLFFSIHTYGWISRFTDKQDYSYGIYIIGYPIQQAMVSYSGIVDPWLNVAMSLPVAFCLAASSWNLIEKPSLKLKKTWACNAYRNNNKLDSFETERARQYESKLR